MQGLYFLEENHFSLDDRMGPDPHEKFPRTPKFQGWYSYQWTGGGHKGVHCKRMRAV